MDQRSLYDYLGRMYVIVDRFTNKIVGAESLNPELDEWHSEEYVARLISLKFMITL